MKMRKVGRFMVHRRFFEALADDVGVNLFHRMVVLRAREAFDSLDRIEYYAVHPDFEELPEGQIVPEYIATFYTNSIHPKWTRAL